MQALYNLPDDQAEFQIQDRLFLMRFLGLGSAQKVPVAKTIWLFRKHLAEASAIQNLFARVDKYLNKAGYLAMEGQIVDATIIAAPKQRNTEDEKSAIKAGGVPEASPADRLHSGRLSLVAGLTTSAANGVMAPAIEP